MKNRIVAVLVIFSLFSTVRSFHLAEIRSLSNEVSTSNTTTTPLNANGNNAKSVTSVKGNIGSITSIISNPTQIINQIQATVNTFLQTLNNTLSGGSSSSNVTSLLGSLKNITSKPRGSFRLEDADLVIANISDIVRKSARSEAELLNNSTEHFHDELHGAFANFRKSIQELRGSISQESMQQNAPTPGLTERKDENSGGSSAATAETEVTNGPTVETTTSRVARNRKPNGLPRTLFDQLSALRAQVDSGIQRSLINARSTIENSFDMTRQNSQIMRNQTSVFINEIQRVFNEFSAPIRNFFEALRQRVPTAVVTA